MKHVRVAFLGSWMVAAAALAAGVGDVPANDAGRPLSVGVMVGPAMSMTNQPVGLRAAGRIGYAFNLAPQLNVQLGFMTGVQYASNSTASSMAFDLLPNARIGFLAIPALRIYVEAGVGPVLGSSTTQVLGSSLNGGVSGLGIRFASGLEYAVTPQLALAVEPVGIMVANTTNTVTILGQQVSNTVSNTWWGLTFGLAFSL